MTESTGGEVRAGGRPAYRAPVGIPIPEDSQRLKGVVSSLLIHLIVIVALYIASREVGEKPIFGDVPLGAGGITLPSGGGGGGNRGTGGQPNSREAIQYFNVAPPRPQVPRPVPIQEEEKKPPPTPPEIKPPEVKPPEIQVPPPAVDVQSSLANALGSIDSTMLGRGGGSGNDGTSGNGSGTGGGIGTGQGTGTGSGQGAGRGGGPGTIYSPEPIHVFLMPSNPPARIRPYELVAEFDVDSTGKVIGFRFNPSGDRGYDRKVEEMLGTVRFRPGFDWTGRPVRTNAIIRFQIK